MKMVAVIVLLLLCTYLFTYFLFARLSLLHLDVAAQMFLGEKVALCIRFADICVFVWCHAVSNI